MVAKSSLGVLLSAAMLSGTAFPQTQIASTPTPFPIWLLGAGKDSVTICAGYAVNYDNIVFLRSSDDPDDFSASLTLSADVSDSITGSSHHRSKSKEVAAAGYEETRSRKNQAADFTVLRLPPPGTAYNELVFREQGFGEFKLYRTENL